MIPILFVFCLQVYQQNEVVKIKRNDKAKRLLNEVTNDQSVRIYLNNYVFLYNFTKNSSFFV